MNKKILVSTIFLLSLLGLTACGGSDSEPDPFEILSGSWQRMSGDYLSDYYSYFDDIGNSRVFLYHGDAGCYTEVYPGLYPRTEHVKDNRFNLVSLSGRNSNIYYTISTDGNYLTQEGAFTYTYLKSYLTINDFLNQLCE